MLWAERQHIPPAALRSTSFVTCGTFIIVLLIVIFVPLSVVRKSFISPDESLSLASFFLSDQRSRSHSKSVSFVEAFLHLPLPATFDWTLLWAGQRVDGRRHAPTDLRKSNPPLCIEKFIYVLHLPPSLLCFGTNSHCILTTMHS